jgi:hypothetical protein
VTVVTDPVFKQIDYLGDALARLEGTMIDPVQFGEFKGAVVALKSEVDQIRNKQAQMDVKLDMVLDKLSEAKGGWRLLMGLGGAAAALGAVLTWFATHSFAITPR